jgi:hypothetical protein
MSPTQDRDGGSRPTKVLYIGGTGRTGSTLLERLLGQVDGVFAGGELTFLWHALAGEGTCSCRRAIAKCPVWRAALIEAFGRSTAIDPTEMLALRRRYWSAHLPLAAIPALHRRMLRRLGPFPERVETLYQALAVTTGSRLIVDTSKEPHYASILQSRPALDVYFLHLVRDPRAVAHSWGRTRIHGGFGPNHQMPRRSVPASALYYWVSDLAAEGLNRARPDRYMRLRYEDLIADPRGSLELIGRFVEEPLDTTSFLKGQLAQVGALHTAWGNPNRFERGCIELKPDDEWRTAMGAGARTLSAILNWPWLWRYGYLPRDRRGAVAPASR